MDRDPPPAWTVDELATLRAMFKDKQSDKAISAALGDHRSPRAVAVKRHTLGLVFYRRRTRPPKDPKGWVARSRHLEDGLDLVLAMADARTPLAEIAAEIREILAKAPRP